MRWQERQARDLIGRLEREGIEATLHGRGVQWTVTAAAWERCCRVDCRHYAEPSKALETWGPRGNMHLRPSTGPATVDAGPDYVVEFALQDERLAGRTDDPDEAVAAMVAWLGGAGRGHLIDSFAFVERARRTLDAVEDIVLDAEPGVEIVDGQDERADFHLGKRAAECVATPGGVPRVAFTSRGTCLAQAEFPDGQRAGAAILAWLGGIDPRDFSDPLVRADTHASLFVDGRYAEWSWAHHLDTAREGHGDLHYHLPLLEALAASAVVSPFFAFTSMSTLCLSRSSHFPFDTAGLPRMTPRREGGWTMVWGEDRFEGDVDRLLPLIEERIASTPTPYLGNLETRLAPRLVRALAGTPLSVEEPRVRVGPGLLVTHPDGDRSCVVRPNLHGGPGRIAFEEHGRARGEAQPSNLEETVELLSDWLDGRVALEDLAAAASDWRGFAATRAE